MVPSELVACGRFLTNVSDKVDRKRLEAQYRETRMKPTKEKP